MLDFRGNIASTLGLIYNWHWSTLALLINDKGNVSYHNFADTRCCWGCSWISTDTGLILVLTAWSLSLSRQARPLSGGSYQWLYSCTEQSIQVWRPNEENDAKQILRIRRILWMKSSLLNFFLFSTVFTWLSVSAFHTIRECTVHCTGNSDVHTWCLPVMPWLM